MRRHAGDENWTWSERILFKTLCKAAKSPAMLSFRGCPSTRARRPPSERRQPHGNPNDMMLHTNIMSLLLLLSSLLLLFMLFLLLLVFVLFL